MDMLGLLTEIFNLFFGLGQSGFLQTVINLLFGLLTAGAA